MTRRQYIEMIRRQIYGGQPSDDASITVNLVNKWLNFGVAAAARQSYVDTMKMEGIAYVNNSFYTTFKNLTVSKDENFLWKIELPQIPLGIGANEGISTLKFKSDTNEISYPVIWLTMNQLAFHRGMREIPNKLLAYPEGQYVYVKSTIQLSQYTASATMISGGLDTDLDSTINVPDDYFMAITAYIQQQLLIEKAQPVDSTNDGLDAQKIT